MPKKNKKFYITTSIAYTNASPHLGFALELVQADILARYHRLLGEDIFFLTGTDEHGVKVVKAAKEAGKKPEEFTDKISEKFRELIKVLNLSNNDFIRTTDQKRHWPTVKKVWLKLKEGGDIYKKKYKGLYCSGCEAFITKKDLKNGKCVFHQKEPEIIEEENYFFKLSKYQEEIKRVIEKDEIKIIPQSRKNEILNFIKGRIKDVSFSRPRKNLKWGIPVPDDDSQIIYVWADALANYISALDYGKDGEKFKKLWPADIHCIGKDILRFHALIWPAMLLSLKLPLPKTIFVHGYLTSSGQKMSKSLGNVIDPFELVKKYGSTSSPQAGTDAVRYFLLREIPPTEDGDFTIEKFEQRYNADLANGLGNLVSRVNGLSILINKFKISREARKKPIKSNNEELEGSLAIKGSIIEKIKETQKAYKESLKEFKFNEALISIWKLISYCDKYIDENRPFAYLSPPVTIEHPNLKRVLDDLKNGLEGIANLLKPFLPKTSEKILKRLKTIDREKQGSLFPRLK